MPAYLYSAPASAEAGPAADAESMLDALAERVLTEPNVGAALSQVQRTGFERRDGSRPQGTGELAQAVRRAQRSLTRTYTFDKLTRDYAERVRGAVRDELAALQQHFQERADRRAEELEELDARLQELGTHAAGPPEDGGKRLRQSALESGFEKAYLRLSELKSEARQDQQQERQQLADLAQLPMQPVDAAKALEEYPFLSPDAAKAIEGVNASRGQMAELAAAEWRHAFRGHQPVGTDQAQRVTRRMRDLDRLEGRLRGGRVDDIDVQQVGDRLGPAAQYAVEGLQNMQALLESAGYLTEQDGRLRLTPRAIRRLGHRALREMFTSLKRTSMGEHDAGVSGPGVHPGAATRPYQTGDPFNPHLNETLFRAALRAPGVPLSIAPSDFVIYETDAAVHSATVLMLDVSLSMHRHGRLPAAKRVALALDTLLRTRFPKDTLELVAFSTLAHEIALAELPDVSTAPGQPFTNMQDALRLATRLLRRHRGANRQIILITDGEPTATTDGRGRVRTRYPPDDAIFAQTLEAVQACTAHGIVINIIMLDQKPEHVEFVRRMAHVNRGRALFCTPETIGQYVILDYLRGKRLAVGSR